MLVIQIFASGVTAQAVRVAVNTEECPENMGIGCRTFGFVMCGLIIAYECLTISMVLHFHLKFRALCWTSVTAPTEVNKVSDPLFRLVSRIRVLLLRKSYKYRIMDRPRGAFKKPKDLAKEPVRTERLLERPWLIVRSNAADTLDAIGFGLLGLPLFFVGLPAFRLCQCECVLRLLGKGCRCHSRRLCGAESHRLKQV